MGTEHGKHRYTGDHTSSCAFHMLAGTVERYLRSRQGDGNSSCMYGNHISVLLRKSVHSEHLPASRVDSSTTACHRDTSSRSKTDTSGSSPHLHGSCAASEDGRTVWAVHTGTNTTAAASRRVKADARQIDHSYTRSPQKSPPCRYCTLPCGRSPDKCVFRISASDHKSGYRYARPPHPHRWDGDETGAFVAWPDVQLPSVHQSNIAPRTNAGHSASLLCTCGSTVVARWYPGGIWSSWCCGHSDRRFQPGAYTHHMGQCDRSSRMDGHTASSCHTLRDSGGSGPRRMFAENSQESSSTASYHRGSQALHQATSDSVQIVHLEDGSSSDKNGHHNQKDDCRALHS